MISVHIFLNAHKLLDGHAKQSSNFAIIEVNQILFLHGNVDINVEYK